MEGGRSHRGLGCLVRRAPVRVLHHFPKGRHGIFCLRGNTASAEHLAVCNELRHDEIVTEATKAREVDF